MIKKKYGLNLIIIPGGPVGELDNWFTSIATFLSSYFGFFSYCRIYSNNEYNYKIIKNIKNSLWKKPLNKITSEMTMKLNLDQNSEKIIQNFTNNWKYGLNRSKKNELKIIKSKNPNIDKIYRIYREMEKIKKISKTF